MAIPATTAAVARAKTTAAAAARAKTTTAAALLYPVK